MPARTPIKPLATARRKLAAKMILRSRSMLALEELHRTATADFGELERREARVVAQVRAHVLRNQIVNEHDIVVGDRGTRMPHAWLIGGPRGIGKATLACACRGLPRRYRAHSLSDFEERARY